MLRRSLLASASLLPISRAFALPFGRGVGVGVSTPRILAVNLGNASFVGGAASGTVVGPITVSMSSGAFTGSLSLTGTDAASFQIVGGNLETNGIVAAGTYSINIVATQGGALGSPFTQPETITGTSTGALTTLVVANPGPGVLAANSFVRFGHPFGDADLLSGNILAISDDLSGSVPYTAMRRSTGSSSSVRFADLVCRLPNSIAAPLTVSSITHSGTTATVTTSANHGLSTGAVVHMEGQDPADYCGEYTITVTGAATFTYTMATTPATNATTAGQMNYTRVLSLASTAGSWNNTLPNSKTSANIISDITANFDNLSLQLSSVTNSAGSTVASGTFNADLATALAATGTAGQLRTPTSGQGPLVCDILALMKFTDSVTPATTLGSMSAWFYVTAFLDQTTGAVQELRCRVYVDNSLANTAMDYYTYQAKLTLGSTVVRSAGLSSNATIDGKVQSFAASAVNTSTNIINIPSHGFVGGETVRFTTTGTLPSNLALNTDYAVIWVDGNNIAVTLTFDERCQPGSAPKKSLGSQGTGTHTVTCWLHSALRNRIPYVGNDGLPDRWTGKTGAFAPQYAHPIHNNTYLQATKMVPPVDLTINLTDPIAVRGATIPTLDLFCYGGLGSMQYAQNAGGAGAHHEYGGPWTDVPLRRLRYCNDRLGYVQTLRVDTLMIGAMDIALINDDTLWRMPVSNNGPARNGTSYSGLPTPDPLTSFGKSGVQSHFTAPTSTKLQNGMTANYSYDHRYILYPRLYCFEGGMDVHDAMLMDANSTLLANTAGVGVTYPTTKQLSAKVYSISSSPYYTWINGSGPRADAWSVMVYTDSVMLGDDACVEKPYIKDLFADWLHVANYIVNTLCPSVDPNYALIGGWTFGETARNGPGNAYSIQSDSFTAFFQSYIGETWGHARRMYGPQTDFDGLLSVFYVYIDQLYQQTAALGAYGTSYGIRRMQAGGLAANSTQSLASITDPQIEDGNISHPSGSSLAAGGIVAYRTDGVAVGLTALAVMDIHPLTGDRHYLTDTDIDGTVAPKAWVGAPPELGTYNTFYVRQASGSYVGGWKYSTTNSDGGIVASLSAYSASTLAADITTTGQTTIQTSGILTFPPSTYTYSNTYPLIFVGSECMKVTAGQGTTTLTVIRGFGGTTAATALAGAAVYVPYTSTVYTDQQNLVTPFPPSGHIYRYTVKNVAPDGYNTMNRSMAFYGYLLGKIAKTAFNNADTWFNDPSNPAGSGPSTFAANDTLKDSVNASFTS